MKVLKALALISFLFFTNCLFSQEINLPEKNTLYNAQKIKNYLPHMTWKEAEEAFKKTDIAIIPLGSNEQHGYHLPLGTDFYYAEELAKILAQYVDVVVVPVTNIGISAHHMGFPGTITISPETFYQIFFESCQSLMKHGIKKFLFINGHGGNAIAMDRIIYDINQKTEATAINLGSIQTRYRPPNMVPLDAHAGVEETQNMLYMTHLLVDMSKAEKPVLTLPEDARKALQQAAAGNLNLNKIYDAKAWRPKETGKKSSTREMTNTGVVTTGDPNNARIEFGKADAEAFIKAAVKFINDWKNLDK